MVLREVIVGFVNIGGIDDHHCLNFLFTTSLTYIGKPNQILDIQWQINIHIFVGLLTITVLKLSVHSTIRFIYTAVQIQFKLWTKSEYTQRHSFCGKKSSDGKSYV